MRIAEQIGFYTGLGVVIVCIASFAFGRLFTLPPEATVVPAEPYTAETEPAPVT
jgi:hypothetical protein